MKKTIRLLSFIIMIAVCVFVFSGCQGDDGKINIGIIQYGSHSSLDNCYNGLRAALDESDIADQLEIDYQNGNMESSTCDTIAKNMAAKGYDMIIAIATPAAVSAYGAAGVSGTPIVFCAVSDPVEAGLVKSTESPGLNCSGTSDILDLSAQLDLILALQPEVKNIGVLYTTSEANSISQLARLKDIASERGITIVEQGVQSSSDVPQAAVSLASKVDCINNFTDNNVVNNLASVLSAADSAGIPVYGSEIEQVVKGCLASVSIDYVQLGRRTGEMALRALAGEKLSEMPVEQITDCEPVVNTDVLEKLGIELPEAYANAQTVTSEA